MKLDKAYKQIERYTAKTEKQGFYHPWLTVKSAAKFSRRHFVRGMKSARPHHLLSDGELNLFLIQEANPAVIELFEQMPLLEIDRCIAIADALGFRYPTDDEDNAVVMSTDLLVKSIDAVNQTATLTANTFKYSIDLKTGSRKRRSVNRTLEKLSIEKNYWNALGVEYVVNTERNAPQIHADNLSWARPTCLRRSELEKQIDPFVLEMLNLYLQSPATTINTLITLAGKKYHLPRGIAFSTFQYAVWTGRLPIDHRIRIDPLGPLHLLVEEQN